MSESVVCEMCERCRTTNPERLCNYCKTLPRPASNQPAYAVVWQDPKTNNRVCRLFTEEDQKAGRIRDFLVSGQCPYEQTTVARVLEPTQRHSEEP